jgi:hypothetical protein
MPKSKPSIFQEFGAGAGKTFIERAAKVTARIGAFFDKASLDAEVNNNIIGDGGAWEAGREQARERAEKRARDARWRGLESHRRI